MVLRSLQGYPAATIAERFGSDPASVWRWIQRCTREGIAGLSDRPRSGRPRPGRPRLGERIRRWPGLGTGWWPDPGGGPSEPVPGTPSERAPMGTPQWGAAPPPPLAALDLGGQGIWMRTPTRHQTGLPIETRLDGVPSAPDSLRGHRAGQRASVTARATRVGFLALPERVVAASPTGHRHPP